MYMMQLENYETLGYCFYETRFSLIHDILVNYCLNFKLVFSL